MNATLSFAKSGRPENSHPVMSVARIYRMLALNPAICLIFDTDDFKFRGFSVIEDASKTWPPMNFCGETFQFIVKQGDNLDAIASLIEMYATHMTSSKNVFDLVEVI